MVHFGAQMHHEGAVFFVATFPGLWQNGKLLLFSGMARLVLDSRMENIRYGIRFTVFI